jgi:transcriptional regulator with XRE-family HTH domain
MTTNTTIDPARLRIGERLAAARDKKGWTQLELAITLGITPGAVAHWEQGRSLPKRDRLREVAGVLGTDIEWLLTGDDPAEKRKAQTENEAELLRILRDMSDDDQSRAIVILRSFLPSKK